MSRSLVLYVALFGLLGRTNALPTATQDSATDVYARVVAEEDPTQRLALADRLLEFDDLSSTGLQEAHRYRGLALNELKRYEESKAAYLLALEHGEENPEVLDGLAKLAFLAEDFAAAEDWNRRLCAADEASPVGFINLAKVLLRSGLLDEAGEAYADARDRFPTRYEVYVGLGLVAGLDGDLYRAVKMRETARGWDPDGVDLGALDNLLGRMADEATQAVAVEVVEGDDEPDRWRAYLRHLFDTEQYLLGVYGARSWQGVSGVGARPGEAIAEEALFLLMLGRPAETAARLRTFLEEVDRWDMRAALLYHRSLVDIGISVTAVNDLAKRKNRAPEDTGWYGHVVDFVLERKDRDAMEEWIWEASGAAAQERELELLFFDPQNSFDAETMVPAAEEIRQDLPESWVARAVLSFGNGWEEHAPEDTQHYIDAAPDGTTLRLPPGEYVTEGALRIEGRRDLVIEGAGIFTGDGVFATGAWANEPTRITITPSNDCAGGVNVIDSSGILFRGIDFQCGGVDEAAVYVQGCHAVSFEKCMVHGKALGFRVLESQVFRLTKTRVVGTELVLRINDLQDIALEANKFDDVGNIWAYAGLIGRVLVRANWIDDGFWRVPPLAEGQYRPLVR